MTTDRLIDSKEAAALLGVSPTTLTTQRSRGARESGFPLVPFIRLGRKCVKYSLADIQAIIDAHRVTGGSAA